MKVFFDLSLKGKTQEFYNPLGPPFQIPTHEKTRVMDPVA
jgi:hypothetical protein